MEGGGRIGADQDPGLCPSDEMRMGKCSRKLETEPHGKKRTEACLETRAENTSAALSVIGPGRWSIFKANAGL